MDTSGFYKIDIDGVTLLHGPNFVLNANYELYRKDKDKYIPNGGIYQKLINWISGETKTYPIDGWYWFDSEEEAKAFFNIE